MASVDEKRVELGSVCLGWRCRGIAGEPPDGVDDLVLQDSGEPGAQVRARGERSLAGERGEESFLDRVLGGVRVAQLQAGVAQQVGALALDARPKVVDGGDSRFYKGLETGSAAPTSEA